MVIESIKYGVGAKKERRLGALPRPDSHGHSTRRIHDRPVVQTSWGGRVMNINLEIGSELAAVIFGVIITYGIVRVIQAVIIGRFGK